MTTTPTVENPIYLSEVKIPHLGPARKGYLKEWFHVDTVQGLAALSADDVEARFKAERKTVSRDKDKIEGWIAKARELATAAGQSSQQVVEPADAEAGGKANSLATKDGWKSFANFVVEFQAREIEGRAEEQRITVSYAPVKDGTWQEDKRTEPIVLPGKRLYQWMQNRVGEGVPREPEEAPVMIHFEVEPQKLEISLTEFEVVGTQEMSPEEAKAFWDAIEAKRKVAEEAAPAPEAALPEASIVIEEPVATPSVMVEIAQVQAFQPPQAETPIAIGEAGQPFQGFVRSGEPFALEASFALTGPGATDIAEKQVAYSAQFHVRNLTTRAKTPLGDTEAAPLVAGEAPHMAMLLEASLQPGVYRLWALVTLQSTPLSVGYLEVPMLQVV